MSWVYEPDCHFDDTGGEYPHKRAKVRLRDHVLCGGCLAAILELGFTHPDTPVPIPRGEARGAKEV